MPRFFVDPSAVDREAGRIVITGEDAGHIARSLRMAAGERVTVCDGASHDYLCRLDRIRDGEVSASLLEERECRAESPLKITVFQASVKGDRPDTVVKRSVEYGAAGIVFYRSSRCIADISPARLERLSRISKEAAMQCGRGILPGVSGPLGFSEALRLASGADLPLFCYEEEAGLTLSEALGRAAAPRTVSVFIGPEGGFSPAEAEAAKAAGMISVSLGKRILRTESAAPFVLACLALRYEPGV